MPTLSLSMRRLDITKTTCFFLSWRIPGSGATTSNGVDCKIFEPNCCNRRFRDLLFELMPLVSIYLSNIPPVYLSLSLRLVEVVSLTSVVGTHENNLMPTSIIEKRGSFPLRHQRVVSRRIAGQTELILMTWQTMWETIATNPGIDCKMTRVLTVCVCE